MKKKVSLSKEELLENSSLIKSALSSTMLGNIKGGYELPPLPYFKTYAESTYVRGINPRPHFPKSHE